MEWQEGKDKFLNAWGALGSSWGINRTMAQIHALLMIAPRPLSADEVMEELQISRGNANMNIRALMDWGLVMKELRAGDRKEYFIAEKDMWTVVKQIMINRKKKELEPMLRIIDEVGQVEGDCPEAKALMKTVEDIRLFSNKADSVLDTLIKSETSWIFNTFLKMVK